MQENAHAEISVYAEPYFHEVLNALEKKVNHNHRIVVNT